MIGETDQPATMARRPASVDPASTNPQSAIRNPQSEGPRPPIQLAVVCDYPEESWPSMDLVGEMVLSHLADGHAGAVAPARVCPPFRARLARLGPVVPGGLARNADRLLNRFADYPRALRRLAARGEFDLYHIVDHSYAQLVHALPPGRAVVTCHDLDTFRCLLEPAREPRPRWFRAMARRTLTGLQGAAAVACDSEATRRAILAHGLLPPERLRVVHLAVHPECGPEADPEADARAEALLGPIEPERPELLHVGSNIPRKRIDVLLGAFAGVRREVPGARLVKVGGAWTADQSRLADSLGIADAIAVTPMFSPRDGRARATLAAIYRRAALALQPSDAEGFGMPVAEALACGTPVLASDLDVLREVGGPGAAYAPAGDVPAWSAAALDLLDERRGRPDAWRSRREAGLSHAAQFRWTAHAARLVDLYRDVLGA